MACPFSQMMKSGSGGRGSGEDSNDNESDNHSKISKVKVKPSRQSSMQITSSLLGEEIEETEDTQTLNLKHLRAAVLMLTNPSVRIIIIVIILF